MHFRSKRELTDQWDVLFAKKKIIFFRQIGGKSSSNWLHGIILDPKKERDEFLKNTNEIGTMAGPDWMFKSHVVMFQILSICWSQKVSLVSR